MAGSGCPVTTFACFGSIRAYAVIVSRVIHHRIHGLPTDRLERLHQQFEDLAGGRTWRGDAPWVASDRSRDLFAMEFLRHVREAEGGSVSAAGFIRTGGDETDALCWPCSCGTSALSTASASSGATRTTRWPSSGTWSSVTGSCPPGTLSRRCWLARP